MREEAPKVIIIPPKPEATRQAEINRQLRVAAYCRVSTKQEDQTNSYEVQKEYYTDKIMSNPEWTMAGIIADKGITGTSTKKREDFLRMIRPNTEYTEEEAHLLERMGVEAVIGNRPVKH